MALQAKTIKAKISSVKNIKKITKAMEMVAASKMRKTVAKALGTRRYAELALELMVNISKNHDIHPHPFLFYGSGEKTLCVVVASNKGLCGGFNLILGKRILKFSNKIGLDQIEFITIGRRAELIVRRLGKHPIASFVDLPDDLYEDKVNPIIKIITEEFGERFKDVVLAYNGFVSALVYKPIVRGLLPIKAINVRHSIEELGEVEKNEPVVTGSMAQYLFEPDPEEVLNEILPALSKIIVYQAILESRASEQSARMIAMKNASDNAGNLIEQLSIGYNQARQAAITQEIAEIIGGSI